MGHTSLGLSSEIKGKHPALMNFPSVKHSGDDYFLPSFLIFSSHQELGVDIQSSGEATIFTN